MKLHEIIEKKLKEFGSPKEIRDITLMINNGEYFDNESIQDNDVILEVKKYSSTFENINNLVFLTDDFNWKNIFNNYLYLKETLRGYFNASNIQFIIAALFFLKRLLDKNGVDVRSYSRYSNTAGQNYSLQDFIKEGNWFELLEIFEDLDAAPKRVFQETADLLGKLDITKCETIFKILQNIDTSPFNDWEFGNIYEYILYQNTKEFSGYDHSTPETIRLLLPKLLNIHEGNQVIVYDPVAGIGGLLTKLLKNNNLYITGSEINTSIAQLGNMVIRMYGYNRNDVILAENCFEEINNDQKYDYIIGDLPINGITNSKEHSRMYNQFGLESPKLGKGFSSLVLFSYYKLSDYGKAVITVSDGFLTKNGKEKEIRKILLDNDSIETIISLPKGTYRPYTEAKSSVIIINKAKPQYLSKKIKFIKVNAIEETRKSLLLDTDEIIREYLSDTPNGKITQIIDTDDLDADLNLSAEVYDVYFSVANKMLKEGKAKYLKDLVHIKSGVQPVKEKVGQYGKLPIIKIENLSKEVLDINLGINNVISKTDYDNKYYRAIVNQKSIIVAKIGENLKTTIFLPTHNIPEILLHINILSLIPKDERLLDIEYLYYQLNSPFVEEQVEAISKRKNALIAFFNNKDIGNIIIPYEDIDTQKKFVLSQKANLIARESQKLEERKRLLGYEEETKEAEINIVRTITHQLKHNLSSIDALIQKIAAIADKNSIGDCKEYNEDDSILITEDGFEPPENLSLHQTIEKVLKKSAILNKILTDVKKAIHLELEFSNENIYILLQGIKDEFKDISIEIKGDKNIKLNLSKSHIEDLFNTLVSNAIQHCDIPIENLKIIFSIKKELNSVKIDYRNNGKPLGISEKEFKSIATKSQNSTGTGVGGYYINKIIEAHSGSLLVNDALASTVHMTIELPLKNDENE